jgi:hypothetical protein
MIPLPEFIGVPPNSTGRKGGAEDAANVVELATPEQVNGSEDSLLGTLPWVIGSRCQHRPSRPSGRADRSLLEAHLVADAAKAHGCFLPRLS